MAQWLGQFSGLTHETKVRDIEESLRKAVKSFEATPHADRSKAVRHLAERLLTARLKAVRAKISALSEPGMPTTIEKELANLKLREQELRAPGVKGILSEFGFDSEGAR